jgi:hypothetical protein
MLHSVERKADNEIRKNAVKVSQADFYFLTLESYYRGLFHFFIRCTENQNSISKPNSFSVAVLDVIAYGIPAIISSQCGFPAVAETGCG